HRRVEICDELDPRHIQLEQFCISSEVEVNAGRRRASKVDCIRRFQLCVCTQLAEWRDRTFAKRQEGKPHFTQSILHHVGDLRLLRFLNSSQNLAERQITREKGVPPSKGTREQFVRSFAKGSISLKKVNQEHRVPEHSTHAASSDASSSSSDRTHRMKASVPPIAVISSFKRPQIFPVMR